jgi:hypothetical protein
MSFEFLWKIIKIYSEYQLAKTQIENIFMSSVLIPFNSYQKHLIFIIT